MLKFNELNQAQRKAVEAGEGPVLIVAGPGTGKTKTLTARIAYLLESGRALAEEIMALTFTRKAAGEMRERLENALSNGAALPKITTFHAFGQSLLTAHGHAEKLLTSQQQIEIIAGLPKLAAFKGATVRELSLLISRAKIALHMPLDAPTKQLLEKYQAALTEHHWLDFDDLLIKAYELLQAGKAPRPRYKFVLVDEFQDTSELQYEILKLLGAGENVLAIGDPNQSIYAFRGAGAEMFTRFRADFPATKTIDLTANYRSAQTIVKLANAIFPDSPQLTAQVSELGKVQAVQTLNEYSEAAYVLSEIQKGIGGSDFLNAHAEDTSAQPRDYAVLYRTHRAAKALQKTFAESGLPYQIAGEGSPYLRPQIQTIIASLHYLQNPDEAELPKLKNLSPTQTKTLLENLEITEEMTVCDMAAAIVKTFDLPDENLPQLYSALVQFGAGQAGLAAALKHIAHISEGEFYDPTVNAVTLLTIHASKGLEFEHVFLIAAQEGILPKLTKNGEANLDEEKRLLYVAVTRAKQTLHLLHAKQRAVQPAKPSRFIEKISEKILPRIIDPDMPNLEKRHKKRQQKRAQTSLF